MSNTYGSRLKAAREAAGLTLEEASRRAMESPVGRGVTGSAIHKYEHDRDVPGFDVVEALAWTYGCNVADLESEQEVA